MARQPKHFRIAVALDPSRSDAREVLEGIVSVAPPKGWRLCDDIAIDDADGMIRDPKAADAPAGLPTVVLGEFAGGDVCYNADTAATLAAEHFLDRGFRHFARMSKAPGGAVFDAAVVAAGCETPALMTQPTDLLAPPRPLAFYAASDWLASIALMVAKLANVAVPEQIAILGASNNLRFCELCDPPLSSIDLGTRELGRQAAMRLDRLLRKKPVAAVDRVPPVGIVLRGSTDTLAIADAEVGLAVRFIHEHAGSPMRVGDIARAVDLDRRALERRFQKSLARSPAEVLRRYRVERAARLLRTTTLPITEIAGACGFRLPQHLAAAFKQLRGQTPTDFRASSS